MAKMETLVRNFDDNASGGWTQQGTGTATVANGQVEVTTTGTNGDYVWLLSPTTYDLTGSYAFIRVLSAGAQAANQDCIPILIAQDGNNAVWWDINGNLVQPFKKVAASQTTQGSAMTYSATTHRWLRIRESGGTTYWDYSTDGQAWINHTSLANPITLTAVSALLEGGQSGAAAATTFKYDNFNFRNSGYQRIGVGDGMGRSEVAN